MNISERISEIKQSNNGAELTMAQMQALLSEVERKGAQEKAGDLTLRVSAKGALSVYGLGRFPVTLYTSQWEKVLESAPLIADFMEKNKSSLKTKASEIAKA